MLSKERLEKLVRIVNSQCKERSFTPRRKIALAISFAIFILIFAILIWIDLSVVNVISSYVKTLTHAEASEFLAGQAASFVALGIGITAIILTYPIKLVPSSPEELTKWYYEKLCKEYKISYNEKPYFKALVKIQCNNFDIPICSIYEESKNTNIALFNEDTLLRSLL
jgi:uncharacterized protein (DUF2344 family)